MSFLLTSHIAVLLALGGFGLGFLVIVMLLRRMSTNITLAFKGDKDASNHLLLPCFKVVFLALGTLYLVQLSLLIIIYALALVEKSFDKDFLFVMICICAAFLQMPYSVASLMLCVTSLSRSGFKIVGIILTPGLIIIIVVLLCLAMLKNTTMTSVLLGCLFCFTSVPSAALALGILTGKISTRLEVRSRSSRSSTEFLLLYSTLVACFGFFYAADMSSPVGPVGIGFAIFLSSVFPLAKYRTFNADTKYWRGLGRHNRGGIGSTNNAADVQNGQSMTFRIASTHLQTMVSDLSDLMIDFSSIDIGTMIGKGATSSVYKAEYNQNKVAIKVLNPPEITEDALYDIRNETCVNSMLSHPNIVEVLGICVRPPEIGIVMEYCPKGTLKKSLQMNALEWTALRRLQAAADLARAVSYVHERGYMHRDIKADNLFVTGKWKVKLGDFGEARKVAEYIDSAEEHDKNASELNQRMTVLGTVAYMAPELVMAEKHYTTAIDVYAMSVTFWEIWTGQDPFAKENTFSIYKLIVQGSRPDIPCTCPAGFKELIEDSWKTDADKRPCALDVSRRMDIIISAFHETSSETQISGVENQEVHVHSDNTNKALVDEASVIKKAEISFRYDEMYTTGASNSGSEFFVNPLKRLYRSVSRKQDNEDYAVVT